MEDGVVKFKHSLIFLGLLLVSCTSKQIKMVSPAAKDTIEVIKFMPDSAVEVPFDEIFKQIDIIDLQRTGESKIEGLPGVFRTDSFLIIPDFKKYLVFDPKGKFICSTGDGTKSMRSNFFFYADNESILSINDTRWIKFGLNGTPLSKGTIPYSLWPRSFIPLNNSTWLFYNPFISRSDTLRLWTTDQNFKIKRRYLLNNTKSAGGSGAFLKYIHQTRDGIYISDNVEDTIYRFTEANVEPKYVFDFGKFRYVKKFERREYEQDEVLGIFTLVSNAAVLRKVEINKKSYLMYYNKATKTNKTISRITDGPDLLKIGFLKNTDKDDRLYWVLNFEYDTLIDEPAIKYGYAELVKRKKMFNEEANQFLIVTTLK